MWILLISARTSFIRPENSALRRSYERFTTRADSHVVAELSYLEPFASSFVVFPDTFPAPDANYRAFWADCDVVEFSFDSFPALLSFAEDPADFSDDPRLAVIVHGNPVSITRLPIPHFAVELPNAEAAFVFVPADGEDGPVSSHGNVSGSAGHLLKLVVLVVQYLTLFLYHPRVSLRIDRYAHRRARLPLPALPRPPVYFIPSRHFFRSQGPDTAICAYGYVPAAASLPLPHYWAEVATGDVVNWLFFLGF